MDHLRTGLGVSYMLLAETYMERGFVSLQSTIEDSVDASEDKSRIAKDKAFQIWGIYMLLKNNL